MVLTITPAITPPRPKGRGWPLFRLGFRPFYLGAALFALLVVPWWVAELQGMVSLQMTLPPLLWHTHEMLFGFVAAVIVGFLLTAGKAWTGLETPRGAALAALAGLWLAARVAAVWAPYAVYAVLNVLLLPLVALILMRVLLRARNLRNLPLAGILLLLGLANLAFHLGVLGWLAIDPRRALHAGLALIVMIECVIAGRVIPAFSMSALPGLKLHVPRWLERATLSATALALASWVLLPAHAVTAAGFALAVGATCGLVIGMITRTARGHTGRVLQASPSAVAAYGLVFAAAFTRVVLPLLAPQQFVIWLIAAAVFWCLAFAMYLFLFGPWLVSARLDGKEG